MHPEMRYKLCKFGENCARDTPLRGVYIPHFRQIWVKISIRGPTPLSLHRWGWNLAWRRVPNFTPIGATCRPCRAKNLKARMNRTSVGVYRLFHKDVISTSQYIHQHYHMAVAISIDIQNCDVIKKQSNYSVYKKITPLNCLYLCQILTDFQNFCTVGKRMKFAINAILQHPPHLRHVATLSWEIKNSNFLQMWKKTRTNCILVASMIFSVFKILIPSPYWLQIKFSMWLAVLLLIYFCDQFVASEIRHRRRHCSVCQQSTWY